MTIAKQELTSKTISDLIQLIRSRNYDPGERLPSERELSEKFDVGRGVVRESLSILENLRYLTRKPSSGLYLSETPDKVSLEALGLFDKLGIDLSSEKVSEIAEVRRIVEIQAIRLSCKRRTEEDLAILNSIAAKFDAAINGPEDVIADLDHEFHLAIINAAHNSVLSQMIHPFYLMSKRRRELFFAEKKHGNKSSKQHRLLIEAISNGDEEAAQKIATDHIGKVEDSTVNKSQ